MPENSSQNNEETLKVMYDRVCSEMDRCRDWHIKYLTISTGLYGSVIGGLKFTDSLAKFSDCILGLIIGIIVYFTTYSVIVIKMQHDRYLEYRLKQKAIQRHWGINKIKNNEEQIFPEEWINGVGKSYSTYGWFYYASYSIILGIISILIICFS